MPAHGGASTSKRALLLAKRGGASTSNQMTSIQPITDGEPVAKKPKLMISNSPISSLNIPLDDWESVNILFFNSLIKNNNSRLLPRRIGRY